MLVSFGVRPSHVGQMRLWRHKDFAEGSFELLKNYGYLLSEIGIDDGTAQCAAYVLSLIVAGCAACACAVLVRVYVYVSWRKRCRRRYVLIVRESTERLQARRSWPKRRR